MLPGAQKAHRLPFWPVVFIVSSVMAFGCKSEPPRSAENALPEVPADAEHFLLFTAGDIQDSLFLPASLRASVLRGRIVFAKETGSYLFFIEAPYSEVADEMMATYSGKGWSVNPMDSDEYDGFRGINLKKDAKEQIFLAQDIELFASSVPNVPLWCSGVLTFDVYAGRNWTDPLEVATAEPPFWPDASMGLKEACYEVGENCWLFETVGSFYDVSSSVLDQIGSLPDWKSKDVGGNIVMFGKFEDSYYMVTVEDGSWLDYERNQIREEGAVEPVIIVSKAFVLDW